MRGVKRFTSGIDNSKWECRYFNPEDEQALEAFFDQ